MDMHMNLTEPTCLFPLLSWYNWLGIGGSVDSTGGSRGRSSSGQAEVRAIDLKVETPDLP